MPVHNADIADALNRVADLLEIQGANAFRVRAYRAAARTIASLTHNVADMIENGQDLSALPGIGQDLASKIAEIVKTGSLAFLRELEGQVPAGLVEMMRIPGLGPKRVNLIHRELKVETLEDLESAARAHRLSTIKGLGPVTEKKVLESVEAARAAPRRMSIARADEVAADLIEYLRKTPGLSKVVAAGSFRRRCETVGDLDILVTGQNAERVMDRFAAYEDVSEVLLKGETKTSVVLKSGLQVDLRALPPASCGAALHYFTGSKAHNIALRKLGVARGLKVNEYGVFKGAKSLGGATEEEVYSLCGLPYIEPELREDRGEIEAAARGALPRLVTPGDIRGDLHAHTSLTDGQADLASMVRAAMDLGYEYLAITEHSKRLTITRGLSDRALRRQMEEIDRVNSRLKGFTVLKGIEVDILEDGSLDLPNEVLRELDVIIASVHNRFNLPMKKQTERVLRAMDNPFMNILGHPTGRLINERAPYPIDMERVIEKAAACGCHMELNAHPKRLDLTDLHCKMAKEIGVKAAIATDAHSTGGLGLMRYGVGQARRGWLEAADVINTRGLAGLRKLLKRG